MRIKKTISFFLLLSLVLFTFSGCGIEEEVAAIVDIEGLEQVVIEGIEEGTKEIFDEIAQEMLETPQIIDVNEIPEYSGDSYIVVNDNNPLFSDDVMTDVSFEEYAPLDYLGRCGVTVASVGRDIMPTKERGDIYNVKPSGWIQANYDNISGGYLYNRSHLIGHQLTGEDDNENNLITGTRYMNTEMITFENMVADYVKETNNHVYYRVTPIFEEENLLAKGVLMEAKSVEDQGEGICFNVFLYNVQPGIELDYKDGNSRAAD